MERPQRWSMPFGSEMTPEDVDALMQRPDIAAIESDNFESALSGKELAAAIYARKLTRDPANMAESDVAALRDAGFDDGDILEFNQVVAYFAYANRTVLGLGVNHADEPLGLSPNDSDDPDNWSHG